MQNTTIFEPVILTGFYTTVVIIINALLHGDITKSLDGTILPVQRIIQVAKGFPSLEASINKKEAENNKTEW